MDQPTEQQIEQLEVVQSEVLHTMKRLVADGFDWRIVLTGTSCAAAAMVGEIVGPHEVPIHFAQMAASTMHLGAKPG